MTKPKIIQIGFNKCGTRSLAMFFKLNNIAGYHYDKGLVGKAIQINLTTGRRPLHGYEDRVFYSDLMGPRTTFFEHQWYFREFYAAYPDTLFILNTRDMERWILSRMAHGEGKFADRCAAAYGLADRDEVKDLWRRQWLAQHEALQAFFADKPGQLLVFNIETDKGDKLADFVKPHYEVDPEQWGHAGETGRKKKEREAAGKRKSVEDSGGKRKAADDTAGKRKAEDAEASVRRTPEERAAKREQRKIRRAAAAET